MLPFPGDLYVINGYNSHYDDIKLFMAISVKRFAEWSDLFLISDKGIKLHLYRMYNDVEHIVKIS